MTRAIYIIGFVVSCIGVIATAFLAYALITFGAYVPALGFIGGMVLCVALAVQARGEM